MQNPPKSSAGNLGACLSRMEWGRAFRASLMNENLNGEIPYATPLLDAVRLFEKLEIGYALAGGVAAMFYGRARFTEDVDFVAASGHMEVLARNSEAMRETHFDPSCTWKLYHVSGVEIDIWKDEHANDIISRAKTIELRGSNVLIADANDLVAMKLRAGRLQDDYDISQMIAKKNVDDAVVKSRVTEAQFEHFLQVRARS